MQASQTYNLFIGSIPSKIQAQELKDYFTKFGKIKSVKMNKKPGNLKNNSSTIKIEDKRTFFKILENEFHSIEGETLKVQRFYKGQELLEIEEDISKKRIYVNKIPFNTKEEELREIFEKFGEVDLCYICSQRRRDKSEFDYGFVTMRKSEDAEKMLEIGKIEIAGDEVFELELKPFKFKGKAKEGKGVNKEEEDRPSGDGGEEKETSRMNWGKDSKVDNKNLRGFYGIENRQFRGENNSSGVVIGHYNPQNPQNPRRNSNDGFLRSRRIYNSQKEVKKSAFGRRLLKKVIKNHEEDNIRINLF